MFERLISKFTSKFSDVTNIVLRDCHFVDSLLLFRDIEPDGPAVVWPKLHTVSLPSVGIDILPVLCDFISRRISENWVEDSPHLPFLGCLRVHYRLLFRR